MGRIVFINSESKKRKIGYEWLIIIVFIVAACLLFVCNKNATYDDEKNVTNEKYENEVLSDDIIEKIEINNKNINPLIEPLKQYTEELLILNYGREFVEELKYEDYEFEILPKSTGLAAMTASGPSSILTFLYTTKENKNIKVEFYNTEFIDYIYKAGNEYKFEQYPQPKIDFDENIDRFIRGKKSIYNYEKIYLEENKNFKSYNKNKVLREVKDIKKGDKVLYGKFAGNDLIFTVVNNEKNKLELISDYLFDFNLDYRKKIYYDTFYIRSLWTKDEYNSIEVLKDEKENPYKFYILDEDKFKKIFKSSEERKVYGCLGEVYIMDEKSYYVGKKGLYYESVNAVDLDGNFYPAYDKSTLPNRICMQINVDEIFTINKEDYEPIDFGFVKDIIKDKFKNSYAGNYERVLATYIDNKINPSYQMNAFSHKLVRIGDDIKYVDTNQKIHDIKEINGYNENLRVGDIVYFGNTRLRYKIEDKDKKYIDGRELDENKRMIFRIMEIKGGVATLHSLFSISDNGNIVGKDGYIESPLRNYLNNDFFNNSFNEYEKSIIVPTELNYYDYNDKKEKKFSDRIWTLKNDIWHEYYKNMNTEEFILSPYSLENEYIYMSDLSDFDRLDDDGNIKYVNYIENRPVWFIKDAPWVTLGWSSLSPNKKDDTGFLPMLKIKIYEENITNVNDYYLPEFEYDNKIEKMIMNDGDLYFMDSDSTLFLIRGYKGETKVDKKRIIEIKKRVGMLYKRNKDVFIFSNLNSRDNWDEEEGVLYISNNKVDKVLLADSVFARLFFRENAVEFYLDGKIKKGEVVGKKYILEGYILTDNNGKSKNILTGEKLIEGKDDGKEVVKNYKTIVVDRDRQEFKIRNKTDKFAIVPYVKDNSLYIYYNDDNLEIDKINANYYEKPHFYYVNKYDAYYVEYKREKTKKTTLRYLYIEDDNIVIETLDEVNYDIREKLIYDGVFYYQRIPENGWAPDLSSLYSVNQNENPKEIKYERLSEYYYYNPKNGSEFFINSSGDIVEIDKNGERKIIEEYISDIRYIPNGVIYSKKIDEDYKVFYYDLNKKYEIGNGNGLKGLSAEEAKDFFISSQDVRVFKINHLFKFDKRIVESNIDDLSLEKEIFYKKVYDYLENNKNYIDLYDLYHIDENSAKKIDGGVEKMKTCGNGYVLYAKNNTFDFVKPVDEIYEMLKAINVSYIESVEKFVDSYIEYMKKNLKRELYLYGNDKKYKIKFSDNSSKNFTYTTTTTNKIKKNELLVSFHGDMYSIIIDNKNVLNARFIDKNITHIIHTYEDGKTILMKKNETENLYDICNYENGKIKIIKEKVSITGGKEIYELFDDEFDKVYAIKVNQNGKKQIVTFPDEKVLSKDIEDICSIVAY